MNPISPHSDNQLDHLNDQAYHDPHGNLKDDLKESQGTLWGWWAVEMTERGPTGESSAVVYER